MRKRIKVTGFSDWETMFYNNLLSIPVLAVFSLLAEDWSSDNLALNLQVIFLADLLNKTHFRGHSPAETRSILLFAMAFSGAAAVGISYTTAWCIRTTSSTTYRCVL
jgi:GDP-mannose transporter